MTPEQTKSAALVMMAWAEKPDRTVVERRYLAPQLAENPWCSYDPVIYGWQPSTYEYRIKPEPRKVWISTYQLNNPNRASFDASVHPGPKAEWKSFTEDP